MKIYCSTGGFEDKPFYEVANSFLKLGIKQVELSSGSLVAGVPEKLISLSREIDLMLHNYFPPPKNPFVLNLASKDVQISERTMEFFQNAIQLSASIGAKYYGVHAGFLTDISVSEIGKTINAKSILGRDEGMELFISNITILDKFAVNHGVVLLVENNVLSKKNFINNTTNPLLLTSPEEINLFFQSVSKGVRLLLDFGHLKVSANTLDFDLTSAVSDIQKWVGGYHMSENHGELDDHLNFDSSAWFLSHLDATVDFATLEIKNSSPEEILETWKMVNGKVNARLD
ncbi:Sugar phosphate isomerase/epimerase [Candidatus Nanopelagicus hibericus]|uniref:Sugar phosphate isomerase/epimerase n=1 Tax=Candidatus Nanopelagicus hibericus TaxID=1884915 RepID=A0A249KAP7_9ACTN|nr:TIM barrel protein [Candidatus Nanopelagicus hibericus]ASY13799.1 Sugar phosphate isomerase/epimerase [Candidatus Nanopelagicus hibericus]